MCCSTLLKNVLLCIRSRHTSFKNFSCAEPALANGSNMEKLATELMSYRAHVIMHLTMSHKREKSCLHNWQLQMRQTRKNCSTELVPFKHMRPYCQECQSHRTIFECVCMLYESYSYQRFMRKYFKSKLNTGQCIWIRHVVL